MSGTLNKVMLIGHTGDEVKMHYFEGGGSIGRFPLATNESYTNRTTGERVTNTEWHNIVLWRGLAEIAEKYLRKGSQIYVEGKLKTRSWQDKEGNTRYATEVVGDNLTMLGGRSSSNEGASRSESESNTNTSKSSGTADLENEEDDDLPFK